MRIDLDGKRFRAVVNSASGEVDEGTVFHYHQQDDIVWSNYNGGRILRGHLIATMREDGHLDARYHHVNDAGALMTGTCNTRIELLPGGQCRLNEKWQWTSGGRESGESVLEEIPLTTT